MRITADQLARATLCAADRAMVFAEPINLTLERFDINTAARIAAFLAQTSHESARFSRLAENLNYSAGGLAATWPARFRDPNGAPNALALSLHRRPEQIANTVYADRLGNGDAAGGDGWRYRGRGLIQITGRDNYRACAAALEVDVLADPEALESPLYAALSAGWFWSSRGLNDYADAGDLERITRRINGGMAGHADRIALHRLAQAALA